MAANERQVGGNHYRKAGTLQHWDLVTIFGWDYFQAQVIRYVMRYKDKNGVEDLEKAKHYIDKMIELEKAKIPLPTGAGGTVTIAGKASPALWDTAGVPPADRSGS